MGKWGYGSIILDLGLEWSASLLSRFTPGTHFIGDWVGPRADLDAVE
jgi:hypothetical protein